MKKIWRTLFLLTFISIFSNSIIVSAQNSFSHIAINLQVNQYAQQKEKSSNYINFFTPDIEVLYCFKTYHKLSTFVGLNYMYSYWYKEVGPKNDWRIIGNEIAVPFLLEQTIGNKFVVKGGTYIGYFLKGKFEYRNNIPMNPVWQDVTYQTNYSESSKFYFELYLDAMFKYNIDPWHTISFGPLLQYKLKDNWMNKVRPKTLYGMMLQFRFWP